MPVYRAILSILVAVALVLAPMTVAWAGVTKGMGMVKSDTAPHEIEGADFTATSTMQDCASMMKAGGAPSDCPYCDKDMACPPEFCMAKCFQFLGLTWQSRLDAELVAALFWPTEYAHPPDWSDQPQPPPPRT